MEQEHSSKRKFLSKDIHVIPQEKLNESSNELIDSKDIAFFEQLLNP